MTRAEAAVIAEAIFRSSSGVLRNLSVNIVPVGGGAAAIFSNIPCLLTRVPAGRVDGSTVQPNDEFIRLRVAALPAGTVIKPGDFFTGWPDGFQRNVITSHLGHGEALWLCVVRRIFS